METRFDKIIGKYFPTYQNYFEDLIGGKIIFEMVASIGETTNFTLSGDAIEVLYSYLGTRTYGFEVGTKMVDTLSQDYGVEPFSYVIVTISGVKF